MGESPAQHLPWCIGIISQTAEVRAPPTPLPEGTPTLRRGQLEMRNAPNLETTEKTPSIVVIIREVARDIRKGGTRMVPDLEMARMMESMVMVQGTLKTQGLEMEGKKGSIMTGPGMGERNAQDTGKAKMMGDTQRVVRGTVTVQDIQRAQGIRIAVTLRHPGTALEDLDSAVVEEMEMVGTLSLHVTEKMAVDSMVEEAPGTVEMTVDMMTGRLPNMGQKTQQAMTWQKILQQVLNRKN